MGTKNQRTKAVKKKAAPRKPKKKAAKRRTKRRIAIVGSASSRMDAPYHDSKWEIWVINDEWRWAPRWDVLFELHNPDDFKGPSKPDRIKWLQEHKGPQPLYMQRQYDDIPMCRPYPIEEMRKLFRVDEDRDLYSNNTISFLVYFAISQMEAGDEIALFGVDMATWMADNEYAHQRPSVEYAIGIARGKGINVVLPRGCDLLTCELLYGFNISTGDMEGLNHKREIQLKEKVTEIDSEINRVRGEADKFITDKTVERGHFLGALEQMSYSKQGSVI